jgi:hypothetical protein
VLWSGPPPGVTRVAEVVIQAALRSTRAAQRLTRS